MSTRFRSCKTKPAKRPIRWRCGIFTISGASTAAGLSITSIERRKSLASRVRRLAFWKNPRPRPWTLEVQQDMNQIVPKLGVKMSAADAKAYIDTINEKVIQRWQVRVTHGPFMSKFLEGTLPISAVKLFFKNWGNFTVEINTLVSVAYHKHIGCFKRHPDLMAPLSGKIADQFIHSRPPGYVRVMLHTAEAFGITTHQD